MVYSYRSALVDQTERALWSVKNVMDCIPDTLWERPYCGMPLWKHLYHMLHSLDQWFINPEVYTDPPFHLPGLNDLDTPSPTPLSRQTLEDYFETVSNKIRGYLASLREEDLLCCPPHSGDSRFLLILAQHRHLHTHLGVLMGFIIAETGKWPRVLGLRDAFPTQTYDPFF